MSVMKNRLRRLSGKIGSMGRSTRLVAGLLVLLAVIGGIWLVRAAGRPAMIAVTDGRLVLADVRAAGELLERRGIGSRTEGGRLLVPAENLDQARALLIDEGLLAGESAKSFQELAGQNDIWRTEAQNAKRWQAAKMATLSRLIGSFPAIRSATVILEPGSPRKLATPAVAPTAAVKVGLKDGRQITPELVAAIADLVAGSVTGMARKDVRIVDDGGRSYRAGDESADGGAIRPAELRAAEAYYDQKVRAALHYIDGVIVSVHVRSGGVAAGRPSVAVSVPRSYLLAICRAGVGENMRLDDRQLEEATAGQLAKIQRTVMRVIGADEASDIAVDWHHDIPAAASAADRVVSTGNDATGNDRYGGVLAGSCLAAGLCLAAVAVLRRRRGAKRTRQVPGHPGAPDGARQGDVATADARGVGESELFAFVGKLQAEQLVAALEDENPQAVALVLTHLGAAKAARVLALLPGHRQAQVARRLAGLADMDQNVLREVSRGLAARLAELAGDRNTAQDGVARVAEILQHAGYRTERNVLEALGGQDPQLAEAIRNRMFAFEDIARLPGEELREALQPIGSDELAVALRTAGPKVHKKVFASLPPQAGKQVRREMDGIGPVRLSDVEAAQQRVVEAIRVRRYGRYVGVERETEEAQKELLT